MNLLSIGIIFIILFVSLSIFGLGFMINRVIKKSQAKENPDALKEEKHEMRSINLKSKSRLQPWKHEDINRISNEMDYTFTKGITQRFNGYLQTLNKESLISFKRVERGLSSSLTRISAMSSEFELFYEKNKDEITIELDGQYFGKVIKKQFLIDKNNQQIGEITREKNQHYNYYSVVINNQPIADIMKNSDRRTFVRNQLHKRHTTNPLHRDPYREKHVSESTKLIDLHKEPNSIEYQWILFLSIFEGINYGFDFTY